MEIFLGKQFTPQNNIKAWFRDELSNRDVTAIMVKLKQKGKTNNELQLI